MMGKVMGQQAQAAVLRRALGAAANGSSLAPFFELLQSGVEDSRPEPMEIVVRGEFRCVDEGYVPRAKLHLQHFKELRSVAQTQEEFVIAGSPRLLG